MLVILRYTGSQYAPLTSTFILYLKEGRPAPCFPYSGGWDSCTAMLCGIAFLSTIKLLSSNFYSVYEGSYMPSLPRDERPNLDPPLLRPSLLSVLREARIAIAD